MEEATVSSCKHCKGKGSCGCAACMKSYGITQQNKDGETGPCSACRGAGKIWVGPKVYLLQKS
ncbi:MAG: hypothetical protein UR51_C0023G0010 [Candidatus Moranbacteria bacterium GW2011_GWF1_34_10]|nr:MAG: hypothetical protein UR51_C0023G0010 [Candidatus Moranbacteria bacterium GW2011_GWF1_34_10]